jgi:hypothetical protein
MRGAPETPHRGRAAGRGERNDLTAAVLTLCLVVTALLMTWAPAASAGPGSSDDHSRLVRLRASRDDSFTSPLARLVRGTLVSTRGAPDGDDHDVDHDVPRDLADRVAATRAVPDVSVLTVVLAERSAVALPLPAPPVSTACPAWPGAAVSRAPPPSA